MGTFLLYTAVAIGIYVVLTEVMRKTVVNNTAIAILLAAAWGIWLGPFTFAMCLYGFYRLFLPVIRVM